MPFASQIMSKRICREKAVFRLRGCSANWMPLSVRIRVDAVRHGFQQVFEELPRRSSISLVDQLRDRELARAVDADEQVELAFGGLHLGDIHVEEADGVALEALPLGLVAFDIWQA